MTKKILVVDDENDLREMLRDFLSREGFEIVEASDGRKGVDEAKRSMPDVILMDVSMPHMDGFQALERLKKDKKTMNIPVIMLTARADEKNMAEGIRLYADKYIPKPYDLKHLLQEIRRTLGVASGDF